MRALILLFFVFMISSCSNSEQKQSTKEGDPSKQKYIQKGKEIASQTQVKLLKTVSGAIKKGGPGYAIEFCNLHALSIKDSLSRIYNCQIKRIALKYRNPFDMPQTETEIAQLNRYQKAFQKGETMQPAVYLFEDRIEYYQPIMLAKEACLQCHGEPGTHIAKETLEKIKQRYPTDLATGFALNDFRGAWKITFKR